MHTASFFFFKSGICWPIWKKVHCKKKATYTHSTSCTQMGIGRGHAVTRSPLGNWPNMQNKEAFFKLYSLFASKCIKIIIDYLCTLTGSSHLGQAESYRCCTIGSIFCDWHMNSVKKMLGDLPFFNMFFF